ncbi:protein translocase subunit [Coemansia brasiliensis]|uniref:Mitochondrial import inner membrane translocase subunit n=1 Tax=Coemansia brasiliensis TaxID=2650707 RepID=A0A9W8M0K8_9FUNG|nr:protein translocase subunit [Coemansia brasiliensis]
MSSFGINGGLNSLNDGSLTKEKAMEQIRNEMAVANAQELISSINKNCFKLCIPNPGSSLSKSDQDMLGRCVDKYLSAWDTVSRTYVTRIQEGKH